MSASVPSRWSRTAVGAVAGASLASLALLAAPSATTSPITTPLDAVLAAQEARAALVQHSDAVADLVEQVSPSVVGISVTRVVARPEVPGFFFGRSGPPKTPQRGAGSGVVVDADGTIVTNHHVVEGATALRVSLTDGREFDAEVVGSDPGTDLAVIRLMHDGALSLTPLAIADDAPRPGESVLAIGSPFGLSNSVSQGIISAVGRARMGITEFEDFIQTDAAINPGNSGGALVNTRGELVGINTAIFSRSGGSQGIGFAIPGAQVSSITAALLEDGRVSRGWLGVGIEAAETGVRITLVDEDGPAESAGVARGDVVLSVNGAAVTTPDELRDRIIALPAGEAVELEVVRKDERRNTVVTLGERPAREELMQRVR